MSKYRRAIWLYPLFQIPLIFLGIFLTATLLFWLLGFGKPPVTVAIALDLSTSTYNNQSFNAPGTIMNQEIKAVEAYVEKNSSGILRQANQIKVFGFANSVTPLNQSFDSNSEIINKELKKSLNPELVNIIGGGTNLDLAIQEGTEALKTKDKGCKELLIVTDGAVSVDSRVVDEAISSNVRINAIILGTDAPEVKQATFKTGGIYLSEKVEQLEILFTDKLFNNFNSNWRWIIFWLGLAWIALMWTLTMPLDRWLLQGLLSLPMNLSGQIAISNALFWTTVTPFILWRIYKLFNLVFPFFSSC